MNVTPTAGIAAASSATKPDETVAEAPAEPRKPPEGQGTRIDIRV